jgi:hypothetical protein
MVEPLFRAINSGQLSSGIAELFQYSCISRIEIDQIFAFPQAGTGVGTTTIVPLRRATQSRHSGEHTGLLLAGKSRFLVSYVDSE